MRSTRLSLSVAAILTLGLVPTDAAAQRRIRVEDVPGMRSRASQDRVEIQKRQDRSRERQIERTREMQARIREQEGERQEDMRERQEDMREHARERARERAMHEREAAERRREAEKMRLRRIGLT